MKYTLLFLALMFPSAHCVVTIDVSTCGISKGCLRSPEECEQGTCDVLVTWSKAGSFVDFELSGKTDGYIALGISNSKSMGDTTVHTCLRDTGTPTVLTSYNTGYSNAPLTPSNIGVSSTNTEYSNGYISCSFKRDVTNANSQVLNLDQSYYILFAIGNPGAALSKHPAAPTVSDDKIDFTSTTYQNIGGGVSVSGLTKAHAVLMTTAWMLAATVGIFSATGYFRQGGGFPVGGETLCGQKPWFSLHRTLMLGVLFSTALAFILIFAQAKRWSTFTTGWANAHAYMGVFIMVFAIANPVMAAFRPAPDSSKRPIFNWAHRIVGYIAMTLGFINISCGMDLPPSKAFTPNAARYCLYAFYGVHGVIHLVLGFSYSCFKTNKTEEAEMKETGDEKEGEEKKEEADRKTSRQKYAFAMYATYIGVVFCLWFAIVIMYLV